MRRAASEVSSSSADQGRCEFQTERLGGDGISPLFGAVRHGLKGATALADGPVKEAARQRARLHHGNAVGAGGLAEDGDVVRIAAEFRDVVPYPLEGLDLIAKTLVAGDAVRVLRAQFRVGEESEAAQPVVERDHHRAAFGEQPAGGAA